MIFSCKTEYITPDDEHAKDLNLTINDLPVQSNEIEESTILLIDALDAVYSVGVDDFIETTYILDPDMTSTITYKIDEQGRLEGRGTIHLSEGFGSNEPIKRVISDLRFSIELYEL